ncbi:KAT8 regulatory NSL complex subunit 1-like isoform X2 [Eleutherodactylus coqui]|uniref:PEHE domain-containing protein n=1 Tax=Eleutherodactylus coqui TaxID=57060 RepID=A0A8J6EN28_ELECQ|nr:hypothetical protein GDO78_021598 [Eleutherodactylus coqui]
MADMAPALTGAAQEAPHRLKLSASSPATEPGLPVWKPELNGAGRAQRSSLLLLNGGSEDCTLERPGKSRGAPDVEAEEKPGHVGEAGPEEGAEPGALCALRAARMSGRQQELGARARRLCRRLQVIQAKQVERHVRQQLAGLVELLAERGAAGLPGSPHTELDRLASSSAARLRAAQGGFDSDATESSSGGESDGEEAAASPEEEEGTEEEQQRLTPGSNEHAEWRWAIERAAIICRWTWLQAQVSDLEFRIRQQTEIYKQIRCTKGSVVLGDSLQSEGAALHQSAGPSAVLNTRGSRLPSSSCSLSVIKAPSGDNLCEASSSTPTPPLQNADKQCSRLTESVENVACQNPPTTSVCASPGSQKASRQVNGFINCVRSSLSCNGSAEELDPEEVLGKKRRVEGLPTTPALPDSTCVAARTRPLRGHKKRRLVRSSEVASLSRKPQKQLSAKCSCEPPTTCILCGCKTYTKTAHPSTMSERIALVDPCYHPILSFPYGSCYGRSDQERLNQHRTETWSRNVRLTPDSAAERTKLQLRRTPPNPTHSGSLFREDRQFKGMLNSSIHISSPVTPRPSSAAQQLSSLIETPPSSNSAALKRKRFENSYDIDNIVIPMSMAAAARVEKIQYKEILTPSWRVLEPSEQTTLEVDPQLEDLSDETYQNRHGEYEDVERSRWDSWTSAVPQRRGSRSSNKSDGRWTPQPSSNSQGSFQQPASPDIGFHSLNDIPLTLSSAAIDNQEPYSTVQCLSIHSRTRGLSWSEDTRSSTPEIPDEEEQIIAPWESRSFPLSDQDHCALQNLPGTPNRGRNKLQPDVLWNAGSKSGVRTESIDSGMSTENLAPASKDPPLPNSISVVRFRAHSGEKIASLEYFPARPVNKR